MFIPFWFIGYKFDVCLFVLPKLTSCKPNYLILFHYAFYSKVGVCFVLDHTP